MNRDIVLFISNGASVAGMKADRSLVSSCPLRSLMPVIATTRKLILSG
ncbi:3585_t:CDS:2 [Cetraspora pellucida]|uniref:3585_t:CDS:1 n=1 Tax=Cetraspora pellucida TaxID=1433469 RepID=A0A9N9IKE0_9GLOM|nr:3585_t:CDS:2 [Cetraspora pellucida]